MEKADSARKRFLLTEVPSRRTTPRWRGLFRVIAMSKSAKPPASLGLLTVCLLSLAGCETARYVSKNANEGIIAMSADTEKNRKKAERMMAAHFPDGYEIVHEYEEKVGSTTYENVRTDSGPNSYLAGYVDAKREEKGPVTEARPWYGAAMLGRSRHTRAETTTLDKTEWRIRYRRKQSPVKQAGAEQSIADIPPAVP